MLLRAASLVLAGVPGALVGFAGLGDVGRRPWFTDPDRLPVAQTAAALTEVGGALAAAVLVATALGWLFGLVLTGAALHVMAVPHRPVRVWQAVRFIGLSRLWAFLRIAALAGVGAVLLVAPSGWILEAVASRGDAAGWSGRTLLVVVPMVRAGVVLLGLSVLGAWAHWARVAVVADDLPVRWAVAVAARRMVSHPLWMVLFPALVGLGVQTVGAFVVFAWAQASVGLGTAFAVAGWLAWLVLQAYAWHWLQHGGRLVWTATGSTSSS